MKFGTGITQIPAYAFNLCPKLQKLVLPYRVSTVDANAFSNCTKLTEITIPRGTANISATVRVAVGDQTVSCTVTVVQPVTGISLNRSSLSLDAFAEYALTASVYPSNAVDKSVEWTSSDETVAIVSQNGKVTPLSKGTAVITVKAKDGSGKTAQCNITVISDGNLRFNLQELNKFWTDIWNGGR